LNRRGSYEAGRGAEHGRYSKKQGSFHEEYWTSLLGDYSKHLFKDFFKRVPLKGYSEERKIFIGYNGAVSDGIPYIYTELCGYQQSLVAGVSFGGRKEIL